MDHFLAALTGRAVKCHLEITCYEMSGNHKIQTVRSLRIVQWKCGEV
jgi:hypothetical protein